MHKIRRISDLQPTLGFTEFDIFKSYRQSFLNSELGKIYELLPFSTLSDSLGLSESSLGRDSYFSPEGKLALMFLKSYTSLSDKDLIAQLNANIHYQLFCGVCIDPVEEIYYLLFKILSIISIRSSVNLSNCQITTPADGGFIALTKASSKAASVTVELVAP